LIVMFTVLEAERIWVKWRKWVPQKASLEYWASAPRAYLALPLAIYAESYPASERRPISHCLHAISLHG
jgi:hypothetical protein